jgi:COP9 signalosome complex subunit 5
MEKWLADNAVDTLPVDDRIFKYDSAEQDEIRSARPWDRDPHYFKSCKISAAALLKMAIHAKSGGNIEVMGLMLGKVEGDCMIIQDCLALPVEGTETRVNASSQAYEYMSKFMEDIRNVDRLENAIGWYHSHPGYGCWLSGIDVSTQKLHQQYEEPFVAIVVDPVRTMSSGKINIGAFRAYPNGYKPPDDQPNEYQSIPLAKIEDFGVHCKQYYQIEISYFKSETDNLLLKSLWNKYWSSTISTSSLTNNERYITDQIKDLSDKLNQATDQLSRPSWSSLRLDEASGRDKTDDRLAKAVKDCEKLMREVQAGVNMQNLKMRLFN